jgi:hypothetical protein
VTYEPKPMPFDAAKVPGISEKLLTIFVASLSGQGHFSPGASSLLPGASLREKSAPKAAAQGF